MGQFCRRPLQLKNPLFQFSSDPDKIMARLLIAVALIAMIAGAFASECVTCEQDVMADVKACQSTANTKEIVTCVLDAMKTSADCLHCVCDILAVAFNLDKTLCGDA